jgi:hypothetical protein
MQRGCTDRWCCANKQTGASKESKLKPLYYSLVLWAQAVGCRQGVTTNTCKLLLLINITSHLHRTGTCSADHSTAKLRILPHALICLEVCLRAFDGAIATPEWLLLQEDFAQLASCAPLESHWDLRLFVQHMPNPPNLYSARNSLKTMVHWE